jgi:hypothetical protein
MSFLFKLMILCFIFLSLLLYNLSYSFSGGISTPIFPELSIVRMQITKLDCEYNRISYSSELIRGYLNKI